MKIDGKATELDNSFQAYNNTTSLYYTVSNDDENLYIAFQATQPRIIAKILSSGITFAINLSGNKKDKDMENMTFTYPDLTQKDAQSIISKLGIQILTPSNPFKKSGPAPKLTDSAVAVANNLIVTKANSIKISGIKDIPDSTLSVYNMEGLKVAATTNSQQVYSYEMLVPLKLLGLSVNQAKAFSYEIKVRSRIEVGKKYLVLRMWDTKGMNGDDPNADLDTTTSFWGEYTLAKKQ